MIKHMLFAAMLAAAAAPAAAQPAQGPLRVDESASGRTLRMVRGQTLEVSVNQCVGCAYRWQVGLLPRNLRALPTTEVDTTNRSGPHPVVGGSKTVQFHFRASQSGRGQLTLTYGSFVRGQPTAQTIRFNIQVR